MFGAADSPGYLTLQFFNDTVALLLPIWTMLFLLRPSTKPLKDSDSDVQTAGLKAAPLLDGSSTSVLMFEDWDEFSDDTAEPLHARLIRPRIGSYSSVNEQLHEQM
jgi:hypothetical protein